MHAIPGDQQPFSYHRRDFLKGGSFAALMTMLGGMEMLAEPTNDSKSEPSLTGPPPVKVALIGLGAWGREILNTLIRLQHVAEVAVLCDNYPAFLKRGATVAPRAKQFTDYHQVLADPDIHAVIIATPTHLHTPIAVAALNAGKHVYCEVPLAQTMEDARAVARTAQARPELIFQPGLQMRSDPKNLFVIPLFRSHPILGKVLLTRSQWHKKNSWRASASNPEREKAMNWRLDQKTSLGLVGELGCHPLDLSNWLSGSRPAAVAASGSILFWKDGRDVPDTIQARFEYPSNASFNYEATLGNSFDASYDMFFGSNGTVMMRDTELGRKAWFFKELDSPLFGWEVYAAREKFYRETGIVLEMGPTDRPPAGAAAPESFTNSALSFALRNFLRNSFDLANASQNFTDTFGNDRPQLVEYLARIPRQPAATLMDGFVATVASIKAQESMAANKRVEIKDSDFELT